MSVLHELVGPVEAEDLHSDIVDDHFRLFSATFGAAPETTLVLTDANGVFASALKVIESLHMVALVPDLHVVGIGYGGVTSLAETMERRTRDLTPTDMSFIPGGGGAPDFLSCIADEVVPRVEARRPEAAGDLVYFGHSYGGLFGAWSLFQERSPFQRHILGSPSLWWGPYAMNEIEAAHAAAHDDLVANVYCAIGEWETDDGRRREGANLPDDHPMKPPDIFLDMVADLDAWASQLTSRGHPGLAWTHEVIPHEIHMTANLAILGRGLRHFFADRDADTA